MNISKKTIMIGVAILSVAVFGYFIWKNYFSSAPEISMTTPIDQISPEDKRDNQRISDLQWLSEVINGYDADDGYLPITENWENISDEESNIFKTLKIDGYLEKPLKDPLPDKYYYGYRFDGYEYELSAILENRASGKCEISGNLCLYKIIGVAQYSYYDNYMEKDYEDYLEE